MHLLIGTNEHEVTLFQVLDPTLAELDNDGIVTLLASVTDRPGPLLQAYRGLMPGRDCRRRCGRRSRPTPRSACPRSGWPTAQHAHGHVWMYRFTWETPVFGGVLRSTHTLEIPFVFDNLNQPGADQFTGSGPERAAIADAMHRAWIAFARTGDPGLARIRTGAAGRRCASTRRPRSWTTPTPSSARRGTGPRPEPAPRQSPRVGP